MDQGRVIFCSLSPLEGFIANLSVQRQFFPTDEDEAGAAKALMRLQDTYKLDPDTISRGDLPGSFQVFLLWYLPPPNPTPVLAALLTYATAVATPLDL